MMSRKTLFAVALMGLVLLAGPVLAQAGDAAGAGQDLRVMIEEAITGNLGLIIGLALAVLGIWTWVVKQETAAGIFLIIGGVLITITPGVFNTIGELVAPLVERAGGSNVVGKTGQEL